MFAIPEVANSALVSRTQLSGEARDTSNIASLLKTEKPPAVTCGPNKLEAQTTSKLPAISNNHITRGERERATMNANGLAFRYEWLEICDKIGIPYILSKAPSSSTEEAQDNKTTISLLHGAQTSGYEALVVTLITWTIKASFTNSVFSKKFEAKYGKMIEGDIVKASKEWISDIFSKEPQGPTVLKVIKHIEDALLAAKARAQGIILPNGVVGSLEIPPEIVEALGGRLTVLFDRGIRSGVGGIKALSLGVTAILAERLAIYGLGIAGKQGAKEALLGILADLDQSISFTGI
ncbi:hypothetical protein BGZ60DRAFT_468596 [Tricladium varicosporioides]|nr:hypothetical protein BGZ60DRAFT_468596 [Hymenoscyphus varicosporioides]